MGAHWPVRTGDVNCLSLEMGMGRENDVPMLAMGSVWYRTSGLQKFLSPTTRMANTAAQKTGISTTLRNRLIKLLIFFIVPTVAPFVPSIGSSFTWSVPSPSPNRISQFSSRILVHMNTSERMAGMQHAPARSVAAPNVSLLGAGIT